MADLRQFKLPDVGEGLTEGEILSWLVAVGDTVVVNQPLCEVETAKAAVELPSPYAGTVTELLFEAGTTVDVGAPIITIDTGGGTAAEEDGRDLEVVDLRSLSPLDFQTVYDSVRRTKRCIAVHEAPSFVGLGAEIAARVTEELYYEMEAPVLRVTGFDTPYPPSRLEEEYLPDLDRVLAAVDRSLAF